MRLDFTETCRGRRLGDPRTDGTSVPTRKSNLHCAKFRGTRHRSFPTPVGALHEAPAKPAQTQWRAWKPATTRNFNLFCTIPGNDTGVVPCASLVKGRWHGVAVTEGFYARERTAARAVPTVRGTTHNPNGESQLVGAGVARGRTGRPSLRANPIYIVQNFAERVIGRSLRL